MKATHSVAAAAALASFATAQNSSKPLHSTVYTTVYPAICGCTETFKPVTYTITESCTSAQPSWANRGPSYVPGGFTTTTETCTVCGEKPLTTVMTYPTNGSPYMPNARSSPAPPAPTTCNGGECGSNEHGGAPAPAPAPSAEKIPSSPMPVPAMTSPAGVSPSMSAPMRTAAPTAESQPCNGEDCGSGENGSSPPESAMPAGSAMPSEGAMPSESAMPSEGAMPSESAMPSEGAMPSGSAAPSSAMPAESPMPQGSAMASPSPCNGESCGSNMASSMPAAGPMATTHMQVPANSTAGITPFMGAASTLTSGWLVSYIIAFAGVFLPFA